MSRISQHNPINISRYSSRNYLAMGGGLEFGGYASAGARQQYAVHKATTTKATVVRSDIILALL